MGLAGSFSQAVEVLLPPDDVLLHALVGFPPNQWRAKGSEKELIRPDRFLGCDVVHQGAQQQLHTFTCGLSILGCLQLGVLQPTNSAVDHRSFRPGDLPSGDLGSQSTSCPGLHGRRRDPNTALHTPQSYRHLPHTGGSCRRFRPECSARSTLQ